MNDISRKFIKLSQEEFNDPGWMSEFFDDIVRKRMFAVMIDDDAEISSFITYWRFGNKRWGFIRKCTYRDLEHCPKQMGKGKHLYVPLFWIREDRRGEVTIKKFIDILKRECPDATTLSWHDSDGKFVTYRLIRRSDNVNIQEEKSTINANC